MSDNRKNRESSEHRDEHAEQGELISRRKLLASIGAAGVALAAGQLGVAYAAPGGEKDEDKKKDKDKDKDKDYGVTTIAQLRANTSPDPDYIYYVKDKGQEGHFKYDAADKVSADNTGTVIVSTSGARFKRIVEQESISVKWFGAKGDGTTDDTAAIQTAIDSLINKGGAVYLPPGVYKITSMIVLRDGVSVIGADNISNTNGSRERTVNNGTNIHYYGTGIAMQCYLYEDNPGIGNAATFANIILRGFFLYDINNTGSIGLDLRGFRWCKLEHVSVAGFDKGLYTWNNYYATYKNLLFILYRSKAIHADNADHNTLWEKIKIGDALTAGVESAAQFSYAYNLILVNISCETNATRGIVIDNSRGVSCNIYYESTATATVFALVIVSSRGVTVSGGAYQGWGHTNRAIFGNGSDDVTIYGNWFNGFRETTFANSSIVEGDNRNWVVQNNQNDEDYATTYVESVGGGQKIGWRYVNWLEWSAPPSAGAWNKGDMVYKKDAGDGNVLGWICTSSGTPGTWVPFGTLIVQSTASPAVTSGATIATAGLSVSRVTPAADVTGMIMEAGTYSGQEIIVINQGGGSITFADVVSNVSGGTGITINAGLAAKFVWDTIWFKVA